MRLLPSERKELVDKAIRIFLKTGELSIYEPCDCGSLIRHNNGGNYHEIIHLKKDGQSCFIMEDLTSELEEPAQWREVSESIAIEKIQKCGDWLNPQDYQIPEGDLIMIKLRRRIEDALRKTATEEDLKVIATYLNVKIV